MTMPAPVWLSGLTLAALLGGCAGADGGGDHPTRDDGDGPSSDGGDGSGDGGGSGSSDGGSGDDGIEEIDCDIGLNEGDCAPDFTSLDQTGEDVSLSDFDGAPRLIIGTAAW